MLKLIKYELVQSWRNFMFVFMGFFILCILAALATGSLDSLYDNNSSNAMVAIIMTSWVFSIFGIYIGIFLTIFKNFANSMFGRPGYLTLTLPVNTHQLLFSKLIASFVWLVCSALAILGGFVIFFLIVAIKEGIDFSMIGLFIEMVIEAIVVAGFDSVLLIVYLILSWFTFCSLIFMAITVTHSSFIKNHRMFFAIILIFFVSIAMNAVIKPNTFYDYYHITINLGDYGITILKTFIQFALYYGITYFFLEKKTEVQ